VRDRVGQPGEPRAPRARRPTARLILEIIQRLLFYVGIPLLIYLRLTA
jgi:hypothetical protein